MDSSVSTIVMFVIWARDWWTDAQLELVVSRLQFLVGILQIASLLVVYTCVIPPSSWQNNKEAYVKHLRMGEPRPGLGGLLLQMYRTRWIEFKQGISKERPLTKEYNKYVIVGRHTVGRHFFLSEMFFYWIVLFLTYLEASEISVLIHNKRFLVVLSPGKEWDNLYLNAKSNF
jgi:hypothetical protein